MSNYNGGKKLIKSIESVLEQSYNDFEFIIIDDHSNDNSLDIIKSFKDERIRLIINSENKGLTSNLIYGVDIAKGNYIARLDVGDYWDKDKLRKQIEFLETNKNFVICATQVYYFVDNEVLNTSWFATTDESIRKRFITQEGIFEHSSIVFRKVINYREQFIYSQDLDLYLRLSFLGKLYCLDEPLTYCEINLNGITLKKKYLQRQYQQWAYRLYDERLNKGVDSIDEGKYEFLPIRDSMIDRILNKFSMVFYKRYVFNRTMKKNVVLWAIPLFLSLILYPPYIIDYIKKIKGKIIEK